jgi:putative flippase GtrA
MSAESADRGFWSWLKSCATGHGAKLFGRNAVASVLVFAVDVAILTALVEFAGLDWFFAATIAFAIAITLHYALAQAWIFQKSKQGIARGYGWFLFNAGIGLVVTLGAMFAFVELLDLHYVIARVIASVIAGIVSFFLNAIFNFKEIGDRD